MDLFLTYYLIISVIILIILGLFLGLKLYLIILINKIKFNDNSDYIIGFNHLVGFNLKVKVEVVLTLFCGSGQSRFKILFVNPFKLKKFINNCKNDNYITYFISKQNDKYNEILNELGFTHIIKKYSRKEKLTKLL